MFHYRMNRLHDIADNKKLAQLTFDIFIREKSKISMINKLDLLRN